MPKAALDDLNDDAAIDSWRSPVRHVLLRLIFIPRALIPIPQRSSRGKILVLGSAVSTDMSINKRVEIENFNPPGVPVVAGCVTGGEVPASNRRQTVHTRWDLNLAWICDRDRSINPFLADNNIFLFFALSYC